MSMLFVRYQSPLYSVARVHTRSYKWRPRTLSPRTPGTLSAYALAGPAIPCMHSFTTHYSDFCASNMVDLFMSAKLCLGFLVLTFQQALQTPPGGRAGRLGRLYLYGYTRCTLEIRPTLSCVWCV